MNTDKQDVYSGITDRIVVDLEHGVRIWTKPWNAGNSTLTVSRPLRHNGVPYSGINVLILWAAAIEQGFTAPTWMTFKQALELNAHVRNGEKGSLIVYAKSVTKTQQNEDGEDVEHDIHFLKGYTVFNVNQIEGLPDRYDFGPQIPLPPVERIERADSFFARLGADIRYGGNRAFYAVEADYIHLPVIGAFRDPESFYATLGHEAAHWTKHGSRLAREFPTSRWGDEGYAREELVAELASAFLCADLQLTPAVREDHSAYIGSWLTLLKNDKRAIFQAASYAQRAVEYLNRLTLEAAA